MIRKLYIHVILFAVITFPLVSFAAGGGGCSTSICNPFSGGDDLSSLIVAILNKIVMPIAAVVSVLYIVWAGFKYVTAQGNPTKIKEANENLLWALIGVGVLLGAAGISAVIQNTVKQVVNVQ